MKVRVALPLALITVLTGITLIVNRNVLAMACTITVTNTNSSGSGSFADALTTANAASDADVICFNISGSGVKTIQPTAQLAITQPVEIDGTTQTGYSSTPLIEINGAAAGSSNGLIVSGTNITLKALAINGYAADGVLISGSNNTVVASHIGTDASGTVDKGNGSSGIGITGANNTIGGTTTADRNVVSGNDGNGIVISGAGATGNVVSGNFVGSNAHGSVAIPNAADGLLIVHAPNNIIGGTTGVAPNTACKGACNIFSGNGANGVGIWLSGATGNVVEGNYIGLKPDGFNAMPNGDIGLEIQDAANNTVGGTTVAERNVISGNFGAGVSLTGTLSTNNNVTGNYIGVDKAGFTAVKNHKMGVNIGSPGDGVNNARSNTIGGTTGVSIGGSCTGACNVIAGNGWNGIYISGSNGGGNHIVGNFIGVGASGGWTIPNQLDGVGIVSSPLNLIGGSVAAARNLISGNGTNGVAIVGNASNSTRIEGNFIGIATDSNPMPNQQHGVAVAAGVDTAIISNSIYSNGWLGIDLGINGYTPNDGGDADGGANRLQNHPTLVYAYSAGGNTTVGGSLNSNASTPYTIQFFKSPACNTGLFAGYGQGHTFIGSKVVSTDASGNTSFVAAFPGLAESGYAITATATKMSGATLFETSEFSRCVFIPRKHADGAIISPVGSPNLFLVEDGKTRQIGSVEVMQSHNMTTSLIKTATTSDTTFPGGAGLYFREGTVLKGSGPDIFFIDQIGTNSYQKRKLTSGPAFDALGYTIADVITVPDSALGLASGTNMNDASRHPDGTLVRIPASGTVYLIENDKKRLVGSPGVFVSHRFDVSKIKNATGADLALPSGPNLDYKEGALVKGSSPAIFIIDNVGGTIKKRQVVSIEAFVELEYSVSEVITIPDNELPPVNGPGV